MRLYYASHTRSIRPRWLLEEMGLPYELVRLDLSKREHKTPDYLRIHPLGQVPALVDGPIRIFESAAICLYLADKHLDKGLAPAVDSSERAAYYQWVFFLMTGLEKPVLEAYNRARRGEPVDAGTCQALFAVLEKGLSPGPYLLGENFSAADVIAGAILDIARAAKILDESSKVHEYHRRLRERPAYRKARADQ